MNTTYSSNSILSLDQQQTNDRDDASLVDNTYIAQKRDSNVKVHTFSFGGQLTRNNLNFYQEGEHIDSTMKGITIIEDQQHVDHYTPSQPRSTKL